MLKYFYYKKFFKNFLIFIPILFNYNYLNIDNFVKIFLSFLFFCLITNIVYLTNNYSDQKIDIKNKLKKNSVIISFKNIISLNFLVLFLVIMLNNYFIINKWLISYLIFFYAYNFYFKKIIFIDLILLQSFYVLRILYGAEVINLQLSLIFLLFFFCLFGILAIMKRIIQIRINKLKAGNNIIPYNMSNVKLLFYLIYIYFSLVTIILLLFLTNNFLLEQNYIEDLFYLKLTSPFYFSILIFSIYVIFFFRIFIPFKNGKIINDIYDYILNDYIAILSIVVTLTLIIFNLK